ncbi:hypothetical protein [Burkholderia sp. WSM2230]|uniref:hypothetical protein n=1 Tax=Burkholderia sp. WSM2230 TaxID=944435 RepID=UPI0012EC7877|nr:hypothetical protein [Burkholderia sp. WSM2230]
MNDAQVRMRRFFSKAVLFRADLHRRRRNVFPDDAHLIEIGEILSRPAAQKNFLLGQLDLKNALYDLVKERRVFRTHGNTESPCVQTRVTLRRQRRSLAEHHAFCSLPSKLKAFLEVLAQVIRRVRCIADHADGRADFGRVRDIPENQRRER